MGWSSESHVLYGGDVLLRFEPYGHRYFVTDKIVGLDAEPIPSVTTITGYLPKDLKDWAARMGAEYFEDKAVAGKAFDEVEIKVLAEGIRTAYRTANAIACAAGDLAHDYCEKVIKHRLGLGDKPSPEFVNENVQNSVNAFTDWVEKHDVEFLASEQKVYSRSAAFTGTLDVDGVIDSKRCVMDFKTGKYITQAHVVQVSAYAHAYEEEFGPTFDGIWLVRLDRASGKLQTKHFDRRQVDFAWMMFCACRAFYTAHESFLTQVKTWKGAPRF